MFTDIFSDTLPIPILMQRLATIVYIAQLTIKLIFNLFRVSLHPSVARYGEVQTLPCNHMQKSLFTSFSRRIASYLFPL